MTTQTIRWTVRSTAVLCALACGWSVAAESASGQNPGNASAIQTTEPEAASKPNARRLVETESAIFWEPVSSDSVIFFVPKTHVVLSEVPGLTDYRRAALAFLPKGVSEPGDLDAHWAGKVLSPYSFTSQAECALTTQPFMRSSYQEVRAANRSLSAASANPVCQYRIRLRDAAGANALQELAAGSGLITSPVVVTLDVAALFSWAKLYSALAAQAELTDGASIPAADAPALIETALAADSELAAETAGLNGETRTALDTAAQAALFEAAEDGHLKLIAAPPGGGFGAQHVVAKL